MTVLIVLRSLDSGRLNTIFENVRGFASDGMKRQRSPFGCCPFSSTLTLSPQPSTPSSKFEDRIRGQMKAKEGAEVIGTLLCLYRLKNILLKNHSLVVMWK